MNTLFNNSQVRSARLTEAGTIEIVRFTPSDMSYCSGERCPGSIVKEIYVAGEDGKIVLKEKIHGRHTPATLQPERFEFPNEG